MVIQPGHISHEGLKHIGEEILIRRYLKSRKNLFLFLGISEIVEAILSGILWAAHVFGYNHNFFILPSLGSFVIIVTASFAITMGLKPAKWLCGTNMRLGIFSAVAGLSGMLFGIIEIVHDQGNTVLGSLLIVLQFLMFLSFLTQAVIAGYALKCCVCCDYDEFDILLAAQEESELIYNPYYTEEGVARISTTASSSRPSTSLTHSNRVYPALPGQVVDY